MMSPYGYPLIDIDHSGTSEYVLNNTTYRIEYDCDGTRYYVTTLPLGALLNVKLGLNALITNYKTPQNLNELYVDMLLETPLGIEHPKAYLHDLNGSITIVIDIHMDYGYESYDYLHILSPAHVIEIVSGLGFFHLKD